MKNKLTKKQKIKAKDVLRWTRESKTLLRKGRLLELKFK